MLSRTPPHNPVTTPRTISPSSPQEEESSPKDTQIKYKQVQIIQQWITNKDKSLSDQEPPCKYSSNGIPEQSSTLPQLHRS